jgi:hypothetical protein
MNFVRECYCLIDGRDFIQSRETAVVREVGESPNDRNDRGQQSGLTYLYHLLTCPSHSSWNLLVQFAPISYSSTSSRAAKADVTDYCTLDRRCR